MAGMRIDVMTLFPDQVAHVLGESIIGRAARNGTVEITCHQIRSYTENRQMQVDDYPYGGGWGMVMMAQPLKSCLDDVLAQAGERRTRVLYMSPQGTPFTQSVARRLAADYDHLVLVCGHYEGVDERFIEACVDEEISLGDFVLTGGEIAAMAIADCVCRMVPGVLADEACYTGESHWDGLLEYPQYTRPEVWEGRQVPEVLLGGVHRDIERWRRKQALSRTRTKRPDLFSAFTPGEEDRALLAEMEKEAGRLKLTQPVECRPAEETDLEAILLIVRQARNYFRKFRVDQWQGPYPDENTFRADLAAGCCHVLTYGGRVAAFFCLTDAPEPSYDGLTDGKWYWDGDCCVLHRTAVAAEFRGSGMADRMMAAAEAQCLARGRRCIRTDTHRKNKAMQALLRRCGYSYRGNLLIVADPGHDPRRQAFEKILCKK